ncbi:MAG: winged helix-turn-helix transcriptional regulator [Rhizobiales bacterium]|nr:winged helix-turn-helix transcriptional regulator [Hyphomicrobiales bacterium]
MKDDLNDYSERSIQAAAGRHPRPASMARRRCPVLGVIVDRFMKKHGNSRTSFTYLANGVGIKRQNATRAVQRLIEAGYIQLIRAGVGTRPSEYLPNWELAGGALQDTSTAGDAPHEDGASGIAHDATRAASGIACDAQTYLQYPAYRRRTGSRFPAAGVVGPWRGLLRRRGPRRVRAPAWRVRGAMGSLWLQARPQQGEDSVSGSRAGPRTARGAGHGGEEVARRLRRRGDEGAMAQAAVQVAGGGALAGRWTVAVRGP